MSNNAVVALDLTRAAIAAGFDAKLDAVDLAELSLLTLSDKWLLDLASEHYRLELSSPPPHGTPADVALATIESLSHGEKCALRNRVLNERHWERVAEANETRARHLRIKARLMRRRP